MELKAIENLKLTLNNMITGQSLKPLKIQQKPLK